MALPSVVPSDPAVFSATFDPDEVTDWKIPCGPLLEEGEQISSYVLTFYPEAIALGVTFKAGGGRDPALSVDGQDIINLWPEIDVAFKTNAAFNSPGFRAPIDVFFRTTSSPYRERNFTALLPVRHK